MESKEFDYRAETVARANEALMNAEHKGVRGVMEFRGEKTGPSDPVLYIGTHTHGNEPGSGAILPALLSGNVKLGRGRVIVAVNNLAAARQGVRRVGMDFNRLPEDDILAAAHANSTSADVQRMRDLARAGMVEATHGLDLHTIPKVEYTGFKLGEKGDDQFAGAIGLQDYIVGITDNQFNVDDPKGPKTVAFGNYIGGLNNPIPVAEIEGGGKENDRVRKTVGQGALSVLAQLGMIDPERYDLAWKKMKQHLYRIRDWAWAPVGYSMVRDFGAYGKVEKDEPVMVDPTGKGSSILAPRNGHIIMPPAFGAPIEAAEDWWYSDPVEVSEQEVL